MCNELHLRKLVQFIGGFSELSSKEKVALVKSALLIFEEYNRLRDNEQELIQKK